MTIQGQVLDALNSEPVASCSVSIQGTSSGTIADAQGNFTLTDDSLNDPASIVVFSDAAYNTYSTSVGNAGGLIYMAENDSPLAAVVVTARRVLKKKSNVAAIIIGISLLLLILNYKKILKWSTSLGVICLLFVSCSSVKKVNKDTNKQLQVIDNFQSTHPQKNDTAYITLPAETVVQTNVVSDTVSVLIPGQLQFKDRIVTKTITITKTITDTVQQKITDRTLEYALQAIIVDKNNEISKDKLSLEQYKISANRWLYYFIILLGLNTIYIILKIKKTI